MGLNGTKHKCTISEPSGSQVQEASQVIVFIKFQSANGSSKMNIETP